MPNIYKYVELAVAFLPYENRDTRTLITCAQRLFLTVRQLTDEYTIFDQLSNGGMPSPAPESLAIYVVDGSRHRQIGFTVARARNCRATIRANISKGAVEISGEVVVEILPYSVV